jgi:aldose 1-epimerase
MLDGVAHQLTTNDGPNHLHGGLRGFDKVVWQAAARTTPAGPALALSYTSLDGDQGYPGTLVAEVVYTLTQDNALAIAYRATCDRDTIVNLTNHAYWNLAGHGAGSILDHQLAIPAARFVPVGPGLIPTGELRAVDGTPFDFRSPAAIGARINEDYEQLSQGGGYDHSYALDGADGTLRHAARVVEPISGRVLEVASTEPALQVYSGNFLSGERGKAGAVYARRTGFALEAQQFPDAPNQPAFPAVTLRSGARYQSATLYRFLVEAGNLAPHGVPADRRR